MAGAEAVPYVVVKAESGDPVAGPVLVLFLVSLVVLVGIAHEVPEGEAVVGGDEINAGERPAAARPGPCQPLPGLRREVERVLPSFRTRGRFTGTFCPITTQ